MRKKSKRGFSVPLSTVLQIEGEDADAFAAWVQNLPSGHGPAIAEWSFRVEIARGIKAQIKVSVPAWDEYREAKQVS